MGCWTGGETSMMPRVFLDSAVAVGDKVTVAGDDGHHFARVLRAQPGEQATVAAAGTGYLAVVTAVDKQAGSVVLVIQEQLQKRDPRHAVYVVQAMAKADKVDTVIQKCTEVGAAGVMLYESERSVARLKKDKIPGKLARWQKVAKEAAVQCQRDTIPVIKYASAFSGVLEWVHSMHAPHLLLLDEGESVNGLRSVLNGLHRESSGLRTEMNGLHSESSERRTRADGASSRSKADAELKPAANSGETPVVIVIGPEGGWSDEERSTWVGANARAVTLGPRILRTETAGVAALTAILYEFGDLGG
ncbi:16S rRNA (uracil(1498)-N(3))-methyltransferase [Alicyclobacillus sp. SO9]|uniref:RsmE family RNA methyltransferase n=1 Tax=Alicyclobacillus sp. SO9 TaxID=2665646 RepID=UPI0018E882D7|nr:RsmE family RNA methyltransferase [Alicyclobacillus sp. SO9]QQE77343.1 16S rRNA (uracil(1498)-N(3))-methyltransferase [Alicyclobacillus sp. SO9]